MCREETDRIIDLGACIDDTLRMVREARQVHAILCAPQLLCVLAFLAVVDLERVVVAGNDGKFARVVEVERRDGGAGVGGLEPLVCNLVRARVWGIEGY